HRSKKRAIEHEKEKFPRHHAPEDQVKLYGDKLGWRREDVFLGNGFYRNDGDGKFKEISDAAGLETFWPWGAATGDFDNDGFEDLFIPSGMGYPFYYWPNYLLMNRGDETFLNQALERGIEPPRDGEYP